MRIWVGALVAICCTSACSFLLDTTGFYGPPGSTASDAGPLLDAPVDGFSPEVSVRAARHRKAITIDHTQVDGDLANFPVAITIDGDPQLKTLAAGGGVDSASGFDIVFGDATGQAVYPHELARYDGNTGALTAWVRVPQLSAATDTTLYIYYGSAGVTAPTARPLEVWSEGYVGVWHLDESNGPRRDSTRNHNDLLEQPGSVSAGTESIVGGSAQIRNAAKDRLAINDTTQTGLDLTGPMTISFWMKAVAPFTEWRNIVAKWSDGADGPHPNDAYYVGSASNNGGYRIKFFMEDTTGPTVIYGRTTMPIGRWQYLTAVYDGSMMRVYVNGVDDAMPVARAAAARNGNAPFEVGNKSANADYAHDGPLDEVHVSDVARSPSWIRTAYTNQSAPTTFARVGPAENL